MPSRPTPDEDRIRRLPLPLAQLVRHAHNAKTPLERCLAAYYVWEAGLKLLGAAAVANYAARPANDTKVHAKLSSLARPSVGHWWELIRAIVPALNDPGYVAIREPLLGKSRDDLPRAAGLDSLLRELFGGAAGARAVVRVQDLFDRLVQFRNQYIGHGAPGQLPAERYDQLADALLAGVTELHAKLDVLAGRRLVYVAAVSSQPSGRWRLERYELTGESARLMPPLELPEATSPLPRPERLYLEKDDTAPVDLHPLLMYDTAGGDAATGEVLFLNSRRGEQQAEYLGYRSGKPQKRDWLNDALRELLERATAKSIDPSQIVNWAAKSQAEEPSMPASESGTRWLGDFELLSRLGRGGMGIVYRARQAALGREVALKCLLHSGDEKSEARFAREIRALGRVEHPNLVKVYTSGSAGDQWFYAMEVVEGTTLASLCEHLHSKSPNAALINADTWRHTLSTACEATRNAEQPLDTASRELHASQIAAEVTPPIARTTQTSYVTQVVELIRQAAEAAHALHEKGVVHRDIKPNNIMVSADGSRALLLDLGLAQLSDEEYGKLTKTRQFVGTLRYASPEQVMAVGGIDRRTDVYSLGATLWELLTLRPLFNATEETPTPVLMQKIQFDDPECPRKHHQCLHRDLEAITLKCLEKKPAKRYASAKEMADDLGRWQRGETVLARPRGAMAQAFRFTSKRLSPIRPVLLLVFTSLGLAVTYQAVAPFMGSGATPIGPNVGKTTPTMADVGSNQADNRPELSVPAADSEPLPPGNRKRSTDDSDSLANFGALAKEIRAFLASSQRSTISIGRFTGPASLPGYAGAAIAHSLTTALREAQVTVANSAELELSGDYDFKADESSPRVQVRLQLRDKAFKPLHQFSMAIADSNSVAILTGATASFNPNYSRAERLEAIALTRTHPRVLLEAGLVSAQAGSHYAVCIRTNKGGIATQMQPRLLHGFAHVMLGRREPFEVLLINRSNYEAAVRLSVGGLSVFDVSDDPAYRRFSSLIVAARSQAAIKGWHRNTAESYQFAVTPDLGALSQKWLTRGEIEMPVTAVFSAAWEKGKSAPEDEPLARWLDETGTGMGPSAGTHYQMFKRVIGMPRAAVTVFVTPE